jgi:hypothetical protein
MIPKLSFLLLSVLCFLYLLAPFRSLFVPPSLSLLMHESHHVFRNGNVITDSFRGAIVSRAAHQSILFVEIYNLFYRRSPPHRFEIVPGGT